MFKMRKAGLYSFIFLAAFAFCLWFYLYTNAPQGAGLLKVAFLSVGQGDSIYIEAPNGRQMLIDGGPDRSVLRELSKVMNPMDRSIDVVVETHPDADHVTGLAYVLDRYQIGAFMDPNRPADTEISEVVMDSALKEPGARRIIGRAGERIDLGGGVYADILSPHGNVSQLPTNNGSIVMRLVYGNTSFMLTGDLPSEIEDYLVAERRNTLKSDVLKAGHHGSKYSTDDAWLAAVHPALVVISAGKGNRYGHPNPETLARIENEGAAIVSTIDEGTITLTSDGRTILGR